MSEEMGLEIDEIALGDRNVTLDPVFSAKALAFCQKSVTELGHFDTFFEQL